MTAQQFIGELQLLQSEKELEKVKRFFRDSDNPANKFIGVRMGFIFELAKKNKNMPLAEVKKLLQSPFYEARMGAVSIMDFEARDKKITPEKKKQLFDLYINHHDHINNWDLIDRSAAHVVGGYLIDQPREILYQLAQSKNVWERRTAIVSTYFFLKKKQVNDTFKIAELLVHDDHDLIHKAVGSWIREAGQKDKKQLISFLDKYAAGMPRTMLRYAVEKLDKEQKELYLKSKR